jgi:hypothetical protein
MFNKLKHKFKKPKPLETYIEIFESKYGIGDLDVWCSETRIESIPYKYHLSIESFIWYNTFEDGVTYYNTLLEEFETWLANNIDITDKMVEELKYLVEKPLYQTYSISIEHDENGWNFNVLPPTFYDLDGLYRWFKGAVSQMNNIKIENYENTNVKN